MISKIYVLDDDEVAATLVVSVLQGHGKFTTEMFLRPADLLHRCAEEPPDAVITDLQIPDMDGIEVTRKLLKMDPFLPVFVLTGYGAIDTAIEAIRAGAAHYLSKPANTKELIAGLAHSEGNVQRAAEGLGITRKNLWEKREKHGLLA